MSQKKLFVSHAAKDKELADALVDLLETGTHIKSGDVFCSSLEGLGIPSGKDFITYIREQIQNPDCVILLLTPNYFSSSFCICEMGASWAMAHNMLPLLVPPLKYEDVKGVLSSTQIDKIDSSQDLSKFVTQLGQCLNLPSVNLPRWETKKKKFLKALPNLLAELPESSSVSREIHSTLQSNYDDAMNELVKYEDDIDALKAKIADLKKCKDRKEVEAVEREHSKGLDILHGKFAFLKQKLARLPAIVAYVMYKEHRGELVIFDPGEQRDAERQAASASEEQYLRYNGEEYSLNRNDPKIRSALRELETIESIITNDLAAEDFSAYEEECGYELSLENRRLWQDEICERIPRF